jgi:hypothetical protein
MRSDPKDFYSDGLDEQGYWEKVDAKEHVELCDYIVSPTVRDAQGKGRRNAEEIDKILTDYGTDTR